MPDERAALDAVIAEAERSLSLLLSTRLVADLVARVRRSGRGNAGGVITPVGRQALAEWLPTAIAALFGATPAEAEALYATPGTVPRVLALSTQLAAHRAVQPVVADVTARLAGQPGALAAVTGRAANPRPLSVATVRAWRDPAGRVLSERVWLAGVTTQERIDAILDFEIARGTTATEVATKLEQFLTPEGAKPRTRTPYGQDGSYSARRLARNETTKSYGQATLVAAELNPFVAGIRWRLSASHSTENCSNHVCATNASADPHKLGAGIYRKGEVPPYPGHVQCKCTLLPEVVKDADRVIADLGRWARGESVSGMDNLGSMPLDTDYLVSALTGFSSRQSGT